MLPATAGARPATAQPPTAEAPIPIDDGFLVAVAVLTAARAYPGDPAGALRAIEELLGMNYPVALEIVDGPDAAEPGPGDA